MKKVLSLIICCCIGMLADAQPFWTVNFDPGDTFTNFVTIDTVHYHHNIWQVGAPHKTYFTSAQSLPNVIVTDTANPYPARDTSAFILKMPFWKSVDFFGMPTHAPAYFMTFWYQIRKDTGSIAMLEASADNGAHWYNLKDTLPTIFYTITGDRSLSDTTTAWQFYSVHIADLLSDSFATDSIYFRFTFISDNVASGRDGWEIDGIELQYYVEGIPVVQNNNLIALYPNPSHGNVYLHAATPQAGSVKVYDMLGREVYATPHLPPDGHLYLPLLPGVYTLRYDTDNEYAIKRLVITQ